MELKKYDIIKSPVITEKSNRQKDKENKVSFVVHPDANRLEIKDAIEQIFNVKVIKVCVQNRVGKVKRYGKFTGKRSDWKKAIVTLKEGEKIEIFEGV